MSLHIIVFARGAHIPSVASWSAAAEQLGYDLSFVESFDPTTHTGGVPVTCGGVNAAFEYYCDTTQDYLRELGGDFTFFERLRIRRYKWAIDFVTHSRSDDRFVAAVSAGALAHASGGLLLDCTPGQFIGTTDVGQWLEANARRPNPEIIERRRLTYAAVSNEFSAIASDLGYSPMPAPLFGSVSDGNWWFGRRGKTLPYEILRASFGADDEEAFLVVSFVGSRYAPEDLTSHGEPGNVSGYYLYQLMDLALGRPHGQNLPQNIPVDPAFADSSTVRRLREEIRAVDAVAFEHIKRAIEEKLA